MSYSGHLEDALLTTSTTMLPFLSACSPVIFYPAVGLCFVTVSHATQAGTSGLPAAISLWTYVTMPGVMLSWDQTQALHMVGKSSTNRGASPAADMALGNLEGADLF